MSINKSNFFKSKGFKLFLTVWIIYIFYLQMYGSSCMANSNSALTASIVNEGSFEIDTYRRASCDVSFYNGHYYSGMVPGISFISVPVYAASKPVFYLLPDSHVDFLYEKLESYGNALPLDFLGNKKIPSNYFPDLGKRQVIQHLVISGIVLPAFTTALFSALSVLLLYIILKRFTNNEKLRLSITLFYAFGTLLFPLSTEFFQRPIAITLAFAAFFILFRIKHGGTKKSKESAIFASGLLAGLSVWFDYFHLLVAGLLFLYLLSFIKKIDLIKKFNHDKKSFRFLKLSIYDLSRLLKFVIGVSIPVVLLLSYHYIIFDNPLTTPYSHKGSLEYQYPDRDGIEFNMKVLIHLFEFLLYSPILIFAIYGTYKAFLRKDAYYHEALGTGIFIILTFIYASILAVVVVYLPGYFPPSAKRYMLAIVPYAMIFLIYALTTNKTYKKINLKPLIFIVGFISIFFNWTAAQYGGHTGLVQYHLYKKQFIGGLDFFQNGPSSSLLRTVSEVLNINHFVLNIIGLAVLVLIILIIWKRTGLLKFLFHKPFHNNAFKNQKTI